MIQRALPNENFIIDLICLIQLNQCNYKLVTAQ